MRKLVKLPQILLEIGCFFILVGCQNEHSFRYVKSESPVNRFAPSSHSSIESNTVTRNLKTPTGSGVQQVQMVDIPSAKSEEVPWAKTDRLAEVNLLRIVLERNPNLEQMKAATLAAMAKYPQAISLDDPSFGLSTAPGSYSSNNVSPAFRVELSQKLPWRGKRDLRGQVVVAEAAAVGRDVEDVRLQLIELSKSALADYYFAEQALVLNRENGKLVQEYRKNAEARYKTGLVPQQDVLQADVEIARLEERAIALTRARKISQAKLNTLMHFPPDQKLPDAPESIVRLKDLPSSITLRTTAISTRPDLHAIRDRILSEEASLELARREYKPDIELMGAYDGFWQGTDRPLQWQIGARVNLPIRLARRDAAVSEAQAKVVQRRAEYDRLADQVAFQVQEAYEQWNETKQVLELYEQKILPASKSNVKEAQSAYVNGKSPFLTLIEAQRTLVEYREKYLESFAELYRRQASLERIVGQLFEEKMPAK
jgi:outer membrane protein, heavy metal efflux system